MTVAPELALLPDAERLVAAFLRDEPRVQALAGDRVYTVFPAKAGNAPLLLLQRVGGAPPSFSNPLVIEAAQLQFDAYGGPKNAAWTLAATTRAVLTKLGGATRPEGVCGGVSFGEFRWLPDETFDPPRPRYVFDVVLTVRASVVPDPLGLTRSSAVPDERRPESADLSSPSPE